MKMPGNLLRRMASALLAPFMIGALATPATFDPANAQARTASYCAEYARRVSYYYSRGGAVGGAARGAVGGAAVGAIVNGRKGARRGAAVGAVTGGVARGTQRAVSYDVAYQECMRGIIRY
jgi:outer membrane lipoprotein SlyB